MHSSLKENCFQEVSGNLSGLPSNFRKWKGSLTEYRSDYSFIRDHSLKESVAMLSMNFDYQFTLFNWIKPTLTFKEHHKYILYQILASIYEALLADYLKYKLSKVLDPAIKKIGNDYLCEKNKGLGSYINLLHNSKDSLMDGGWKIYLDDICELRNTVHPSKLKSPNLRNNRALKSGLENAQLNLNNFSKNLKKRY